MTLLAGFLDVLLRGLGLVALAISAGGVAWALWALRPLGTRTPLLDAAVRRTLGLVVAGAVGLAASRIAGLLILHPWALADESGRWPVAEFLSTDFGRAGLASAGLALGLGAAALRVRARPGSRSAWAAATVAAGLVLASAAWLAHATSRLEGRAPLMALTVLHQGGAVVWIGALVHLIAFWPATRGREPAGRAAAGAGEAERLRRLVLGRVSTLAATCVGLLLAPGLLLAGQYVGGAGGLIGTGYGVMVLTKSVLLAVTLALGAVNLVTVRRSARDASSAPAPPRVRALVEAEVGVGVTLLLAAAALTSLPPAVDVVADRATPAEVAGRFVPKLPSLTSPPVERLLAVAGPIADTLATRQPEEYAWSEYNHHSAGIFVLAMGILALAERTGRARWARHWPLLFLGLAAFMFVRNDPRAWPLGPAGFWESMVLPDVLQHRLALLVVVALGVFEWLVRTGRLTHQRWRLLFPLLCAAGGAVLLTHSHAMFNLKAEFLIEVSHAPMGVLAVIMGWGRWIELRGPAGDRRTSGWVSSTAMALIGVILLVYRET